MRSQTIYHIRSRGSSKWWGAHVDSGDANFYHDREGVHSSARRHSCDTVDPAPSNGDLLCTNALSKTRRSIECFNWSWGAESRKRLGVFRGICDPIIKANILPSIHFLSLVYGPEIVTEYILASSIAQNNRSRSLSRRPRAARPSSSSCSTRWCGYMECIILGGAAWGRGASFKSFLRQPAGGGFHVLRRDQTDSWQAAAAAAGEGKVFFFSYFFSCEERHDKSGARAKWSQPQLQSVLLSSSTCAKTRRQTPWNWIQVRRTSPNLFNDRVKLQCTPS